MPLTAYAIQVLAWAIALGSGTQAMTMSSPRATAGGAGAVTAQSDSRAGGNTGIAECDTYVAMVTACLPKMCEDERLLVELELSFHRELTPKVIKLKGRQEAAQGCAQDIREAIRNDPYGCYTSRSAEASASTPAIQRVQVRPAHTSVTMTFTGSGPGSGAGAPETPSKEDEDAGWQVIIGTSLTEAPTAVYRLLGRKGQFVLDTATEPPVTQPGGAAQRQPLRLKAGTRYCFVINSPAANGGVEIQRKGIFTTLPKR